MAHYLIIVCRSESRTVVSNFICMMFISGKAKMFISCNPLFIHNKNSFGASHGYFLNIHYLFIEEKNKNEKMAPLLGTKC